MEKRRVLILAPFSAEGLDALAAGGFSTVHESWLEAGRLQDPEELGRRLDDGGFDAVVVEGDFLFSETYDAASDLKFAGVCRSAVNQIDVEAATERGIMVVNTPGRNANAVAEMTLALMLAVMRRVAEGDRYVRGRKWDSPVAPYSQLRGSELGGRTLGIVGLGAVGRRVAGLAGGFGMNVLAYDPFVTPQEADGAGATWTDLNFMLEVADAITLHAPPPEDGEPLLGRSRVDGMKDGAVLINTAAAELIDQKALADALRSGKLAGAGLDIFPSHPVEPSYSLLDMDNVVLTPHIGGATGETVARHSHAMAQDLIAFSRGERPLNLINPEVWERRRG